MLAVIVLAAVGYLAGVRALRRRGETWPVTRTAVFVGGGLGSLLLATASFINVYADTLLWVRAIQLTWLFLLTPLFLALGRPVTLAAAVLPAHRRVRARRALHSRPARVIAYPVVGSVLLTSLPWVVFFTPWSTAMFRHEAVDDATRLLLLAVGFLYYWTRLQLDPVPTTYPATVSLFIALAEVILNIALGLLLILGAGQIAREYFLELARPWGPSLLLDQQMAGGYYWVIGHAAGIPFLVFAFRQAKKDDDRAAAVIDAALDARPAPAAGELTRPWWETDPRVRHGRTAVHPTPRPEVDPRDVGPS